MTSAPRRDRDTVSFSSSAGDQPTQSTACSRGILRRAVVWLALLIVGLAALACGMLGLLGWVASGQVLHPTSAPDAGLPSHYPTLKPQNVTVAGTNGTLLAGRFFPGRTTATIILSHGYGATQDQMLPWANFLHQAGFSVFTYDMRGCGQSSGSITFGALEQRDLISVVDYLVARPDVDKAKIGTLGFSMGGATTIMAAAQDTRIKAVVDDSGYADIRHWFNTSIGELLRHPTDPFSILSLKMVEWRAGIDADSLRPSAKIALISPRPVLIIQGTADHDLSLNNSQENFAAAKQPKELWWVPGATHGQTLEHAGAAYVRRVVGFFSQALHP